MIDELLQCYDASGNPTETHPRSEVKKQPPRWWYAVVRVFIVNSKNEVLCSKRSNGVSANPGKWQFYFGGHVGAGELFTDVAVRELEEEAGLRVNTEDVVEISTGKKIDKLVHYTNYMVRFDGDMSDIHFSDNEVAEVRWFTISELMNDFLVHSDQWSTACTVDDLESLSLKLTTL